MVFVFETEAKIEADRRIDGSMIDKFSFIQSSENIVGDLNALWRINDIIEEYLEAAKCYLWDQNTIGTLVVFTHAFLNAGCWGNRDIPGKIICGNIKYGSLGSVISIQDEGKGFDYRSQIEKLLRGERHDFANNGRGLINFNRSNLHIAYHGNGNRISIATPLPEFLRVRG